MRILDVVDMQNGFMKADSDLPVGANQEGAAELIGPTNQFFKELTEDVFDLALFKYDTHFSGEYDNSPEAQAFPLHCEYGNPGWQLAVEPSMLPANLPTYYMTKNTFDMWADNPVSETVAFTHEREEKAYQNLYRITDDRNCLDEGMERDKFFNGLNEGDEVVMIGVASDFCVHDAMLGYLERGARVTVLEDLVKGIGTDLEGRAKSGHINDVVQLPVFKPYLDSGQLQVKTSRSFLLDAQPDAYLGAPRPAPSI